ncbi:MAG: hypothetical protein AVO35_06015 [Candidatus Aegiribacteria sp. MLS_C]|nr:MAG: hypothetical protein AVO35_06015 [Candidatus Aegiribacteria sp. MLS_C]
MISSEDALRIVLENSSPGGCSTLPLDGVTGLVLAEDVHSDTDLPCVDSAACDGFAVYGEELRYELSSGIDLPEKTLEKCAFPVRKGDPVPRGTDRVVCRERASVEDGILYIEEAPLSGANVVGRGETAGEGRLLIETGTRLSPQHVGIAALAGREVLRVFTRPATAVVSVGDDLVPSTWRMAPGRARDPLMPLLRSQLECGGFSPVVVIHASVEKDRLTEGLEQALSCSEVVLVAGCSGTASLVLEQMGFEAVFRSVAQSPAGDLVFAVGKGGGRVFLLPDEPVSAMVAAEEYVLPCLRSMSGFKGCRKRVYSGESTFDHQKPSGLLSFVGVLAYREGNSWKLHRPEHTRTSGLPGCASINALALAAPDRLGITTGEKVPFHFLCSTAAEISFA